MKNRIAQLILAISIISLLACAANDQKVVDATETGSEQKLEEPKYVPHPYGGWYCPDNLNGFPAVDIADWENVPVVKDRLPTQEETRSEASLILVDTEKYPDAHALKIQLPKLARFYNRSASRMDLVIVIQAIYVDSDSIVGFRYLNGGNGSARLNEVHFLSDEAIASIAPSHFVTQDIAIDAHPKVIWDVLTNTEYTEKLQATFDPASKLTANWREETNINYHYAKAGKPTALYGDILFSNHYAQNDFENGAFTEKFLIIQDQETGATTLKIVCGPFAADFETQQSAINKWAQEVKVLSEGAAQEK